VKEINKLLNALEASLYAMQKHAPELCSREKETAKKILIEYSRLPKANKSIAKLKRYTKEEIRRAFIPATDEYAFSERSGGYTIS